MIDLRTLQKEFSSVTILSKDDDFGVYLGDLESVFGLLLQLVDSYCCIFLLYFGDFFNDELRVGVGGLSFLGYFSESFC